MLWKLYRFLFDACPRQKCDWKDYGEPISVYNADMYTGHRSEYPVESRQAQKCQTCGEYRVRKVA
jgi:hypothetical protein